MYLSDSIQGNNSVKPLEKYSNAAESDRLQLWNYGCKVMLTYNVFQSMSAISYVEHTSVTC